MGWRSAPSGGPVADPRDVVLKSGIFQLVPQVRQARVFAGRLARRLARGLAHGEAQLKGRDGAGSGSATAAGRRGILLISGLNRIASEHRRSGTTLHAGQNLALRAVGHIPLLQPGLDAEWARGPRTDRSAERGLNRNPHSAPSMRACPSGSSAPRISRRTGRSPPISRLPGVTDGEGRQCHPIRGAGERPRSPVRRPRA